MMKPKQLRNRKYYYLKVKKICHKHETEPDWFQSKHGLIIHLYFLKEQAEQRARVYSKKRYKVKVVSCSIKGWFEDDKELEQKTAKGLKEFRHKNWDSSLSKEEAYKKYMDVKE